MSRDQSKHFVQFLAFGDLDFLLKMFCNIDHSWPQLVFWRTLLESLFALCNLKRNLAKNKNENIGFRPPLHDHQILIQRERKIEKWKRSASPRLREPNVFNNIIKTYYYSIEICEREREREKKHILLYSCINALRNI